MRKKLKGFHRALNNWTKLTLLENKAWVAYSTPNTRWMKMGACILSKSCILYPSCVSCAYTEECFLWASSLMSAVIAVALHHHGAPDFRSTRALLYWHLDTHLPHLPFRADRNSTEGGFGNCLTRIREKHAVSFVGWLPGYVWLCLLWTVVLRRPVSGWHDPLLSRCPAPSTAMETGTAKDPCPALTAECNWQKCLDMPECQKPRC